MANLFSIVNGEELGSTGGRDAPAHGDDENTGAQGPGKATPGWYPLGGSWVPVWWRNH